MKNRLSDLNNHLFCEGGCAMTFTAGFAEPILWGVREAYTVAEVAAGLEIDQHTVVLVVEQFSARFPLAPTRPPAPELPAWKRPVRPPPKPRHRDDAELDRLTARERNAAWTRQHEGAAATRAGAR